MGAWKSRRKFHKQQSVVFLNTFMHGEGNIDKDSIEMLHKYSADGMYPLRCVMRTYKNWNRVKHQIKTRPDSEFGISHVPHGSALYDLIVRQTTGMSVSHVRTLGRREHASTKKQLLKVTQTKNLKEAARKCKSECMSFESYKDVEHFVKHKILRDLMRIARETFYRVPIKLSEFPPIQVRKLRPGMSMAYYELPKSSCKYPLGKRSDKGRVVVQIEDLRRVNIPELTVLIAHEVFPGHFFQTVTYPTAPYIFANWYVEGWALYTERLCDTFGPMFVAARLLMRLLRAARCIIDPAIHLDGLTFADAKKRFKKLVPHLSTNIRNAELLRYAAIPGQACGYLPGAVQIERWSKKYSHDLKRFHDVLLSGGAGSVAYVRANLTRSLRRRR
jgi:uncharacterized protein (DUF885 family)